MAGDEAARSGPRPRNGRVSSTPRSDRRRTVLVALVPTAAFIAMTMIRIVRQPRLDFNETMFLDVGRQIVATGLPYRTFALPSPALFFDHTPLYVYFVAAVTALGGPTAVLLRSTTWVLGLLTVLLVFRIALDGRGLGSAFVAAMLVALNPFFAKYSWFVRMEVPFCFFLVLALYLLMTHRWLLSGLAIAVAVMLKEVALAFWLVAVLYAAWRGGARAAVRVAIPAPVAFVVWLAYAASIGYDQLIATMDRWFGSAVGMDISDHRLRIGPLRWARTVLADMVGPLLIFASGACAALALTMRRPIPRLTIVPIAYVAIAVAASFAIKLKEPRFLIAIIPMTAIAIGLLVDWTAVWSDLRRVATTDRPHFADDA